MVKIKIQLNPQKNNLHHHKYTNSEERLYLLYRFNISDKLVDFSVIAEIFLRKF